MKNRPHRLPPFVQAFVDRHGRPRYYFRRKGHKGGKLPGSPWSPEFMAAHEAYMKGAAISVSVGQSRTQAGSINALVASYYQSAEYQTCKPVTRRFYRNVIERIRAEHGDKVVVNLERKHVKAIIAKLSDRPNVANNFLKCLKVLMRHALDLDMICEDPTRSVKKLRTESKGFATWHEEHIEQFRKAHPVGTLPRTAFELILHTGLRRTDAVTVGHQHVRNGVIEIRQSKTAGDVSIPIHPQLREALDAAPRTGLHFITGERGGPLTPESFGNYFREAVVDAKLPAGLSAHGLRKAACRRLAEAGLSPHHIMAISGHKSLSEVERYTREANRVKLAHEAIAAMPGGSAKAKTGTASVKPAEGFDNQSVK